MKQIVFFQDLGNRAYEDIWKLQEKYLKENIEKKLHNQEQTTKNYLFFVEHNPVYTLGKSGKPQHILISEQDRIAKQIEYFHTNRGGDITFHGKEQIVGYPIFDLDKFKPDLGWYLRSLEEVVILSLATFGIKGERSLGETGVWIDVEHNPRKICAMGIRCSRWITMHGFALNVNTDLTYFNHIIPCGIANKKVSSIEKELGEKIAMEAVKNSLKQNFESVFNCQLQDIL